MTSRSEPFVARLVVPATVESVRPAAAYLVDAARRLDLPVAGNPLFEVAIVEAITNALNHNPREGDTSLHCELELDGRCVRVRVLDDAARLPVQVAAPALPAPVWTGAPPDWQTLPEGGYGMYLIHAVFPTVRPCSRDGRHGIELELTF